MNLAEMPKGEGRRVKAGLHAEIARLVDEGRNLPSVYFAVCSGENPWLADSDESAELVEKLFTRLRLTREVCL